MSQIDEQGVADFLKQNPDFFNRQPDLLASMTLPHNPLGASSLLVRQQQLLREQNQSLLSRLNDLIQQAHKNERIYLAFSALHRLLLEELDNTALTAKIETLACEKLPLSACRLLPYGDQYQPLLEHRLADNGIYLGRLSADEQHLIFERECQSAALYLIGGAKSPLALLAFASEDSAHFEPAQDSFFVMEFVSALEQRLKNTA